MIAHTDQQGCMRYLLDGAFLIAQFSECLEPKSLADLATAKDSVGKGALRTAELHLKEVLSATDDGNEYHDDPLVQAVRNVSRHVLIYTMAEGPAQAAKT